MVHQDFKPTVFSISGADPDTTAVLSTSSFRVHEDWLVHPSDAPSEVDVLASECSHYSPHGVL